MYFLSSHFLTLEGRLVAHRREIRVNLGVRHPELVQPEVVAHESRACTRRLALGSSLLVGVLDVEEVALTQEGLRDPIVSVHPVDGDRQLGPVNNHALVDALLIGAIRPEPRQLGLVALNNLDLVVVEHLDAGDGPSGRTELVEEGPLGGLTPVDL